MLLPCTRSQKNTNIWCNTYTNLPLTYLKCLSEICLTSLIALFWNFPLMIWNFPLLFSHSKCQIWMSTLITIIIYGVMFIKFIDIDLTLLIFWNWNSQSNQSSFHNLTNIPSWLWFLNLLRIGEKQNKGWSCVEKEVEAKLSILYIKNYLEQLKDFAVFII